MKKKDTRSILEKQLQSVSGSWERLPILLELSDDPFHPDQALDCAREAHAIARELNDPYWTACSLRQLSLHRMRKGNYAEGVACLKEASTIFASINDTPNKSYTDLSLAQTLVSVGEFDQAMRTLLELYPIFRDLDDQYRLSGLYGCMGNIYRILGDHSRGLKLFRRAINISLKQGDLQDTGRYYAYLAGSYKMLEDSPTYRKYMRKSLAAHYKAGHLPGIAVALGNIGNSYIDERRYPKAEKYVRLSGKIYRKLGYVAHEALSWGRLGGVYHDRNEIEKAYRCHRKSLALARDSDEAFTLSTICSSFGGFCILNDRMQEGINLLKEAIALMERFGNTYHQFRAYETLGDAYEMIGDTTAALACFRKYKEIKEEFLSSQKIREAGRMEISMRLKSIRKELQKERSQTSHLKKQIEEQEAELVSLTLSLLGKGEHTGKHPGTDPNLEKPASTNWEIFARQFHKIHNDFYFKLLRKYDTLTPAEIKVCSLIRIGLSSKEIADLLCISKRTVDTHRVRIHKKMNLPRGTHLTGHITRM